MHFYLTDGSYLYILLMFAIEYFAGPGYSVFFSRDLEEVPITALGDLRSVFFILYWAGLG